MKWFKHYSDMHEGETINELFDQLGHKGLAFFLLQEICCEKLQKNKGEILTKDACLFRFPVRNVRQKLRLSATNLEVLLRICATKGQLSWKLEGKILQIEMPILLDLLDSDTKKARQTRAEAATQAGLDKEIDKDKEEEIEKELKLPSIVKSKPSPQDSEQNKLIKQEYINAYRLRYGVDPSTSGAAFNSQVSNLRKKLGVEESIKVVRFYLTHNKSFYLSNTHSFKYCLSDAETLRTQMLRGQAITQADVRNFEQQNHHLSQIERIKKGSV